MTGVRVLGGGGFDEGTITRRICIRLGRVGLLHGKKAAAREVVSEGRGVLAVDVDVLREVEGSALEKFKRNDRSYSCNHAAGGKCALVPELYAAEQPITTLESNNEVFHQHGPRQLVLRFLSVQYPSLIIRLVCNRWNNTLHVSPQA
jgi:hypothetical protein